MKSLEELQNLPEFHLITTVPGSHPETSEPCLLAKANADQLLVVKSDDMAEFPDPDGTPMRVVNTRNGLMKMRV